MSEKQFLNYFDGTIKIIKLQHSIDFENVQSTQIILLNDNLYSS